QADDPRREPDRADEERRQASGGEGVSQVPLVVEGTEAVRRHGLPPGPEIGLQPGQVQVQAAEDAVHDQLQGARTPWLEGGSVPLLRPQQRSDDEDHWPLARPYPSLAPARSQTAPAALCSAASPSAT